jgi:TetR/AcrR family transcriptional regulator
MGKSMNAESDQPKVAKQSKRKQTEIRSRDPDRTSRAILDAARVEFCQHGFNGARIERISRRSKSNMRMIYHYFGNKEGVYLSVLESVYSDIRNQELKLDLANSAPLEGMRRLILFSVDFFAKRSDFIALISTENILKGRFLKRLPSIQAMSTPLIDAIRVLLHRGEKEGVFQAGIDPLQFYVSIVAQSQLHISNRYTLSILFNQDLTDQDWLRARREHTVEMLLTYLSKPS